MRWATGTDGGADAAGNMTYDGPYAYTYDAWNRLTKVERAYLDSSAAMQTGTTVAEMQYDGLHRRTVKEITNCGDWNAEYHYYWDTSWRLLEMRDEDAYPEPLGKQYIWGVRYVDELVAVGVNGDDNPGCDNLYYAVQNANFNVIGLVGGGAFRERYEYTPYGQRRAYVAIDEGDESDDDLLSRPLFESEQISTKPYSLCDIGHQGLIHDKEFGLIYNRYRYRRLDGRWMMRDPLGYPDGMSLYESLRSSPLASVDPAGLRESRCYPGCCPGPDQTKKVNERIRSELRQAWNMAMQIAPSGTWGGERWAKGKKWFRRVFTRHLWTHLADNTGGWKLDTKLEKKLYEDLGTRVPGKISGTNAPCINICDTCIGTDKLGHMFQQGYMTWSATQSYLAKFPGGDADRFAETFSKSTESILGPMKQDWEKSEEERTEDRNIAAHMLAGSFEIPQPLPQPPTRGDFGSTVRNYDLVGYWGGYKEKGHTIEASKADHHANMQGRNMWADFYALDLKEHADGKWIDTWNVCKYITGKGLEDQKKPHPDMPWTQPKPKPKPKPKIVPSGPSRHPPTGTFDQPLD